MSAALLRDVPAPPKTSELARETELVAHVSHEMRAPISAIKGYAETLLKGGLYDSRNRLRFVRTIERHADRLLELVDNLLHLAVLDHGAARRAPQAVDLQKAVRTALADVRILARSRRISMRADVPAGLRVSVDKSQLSQVLQNLLTNAIKYNRRTGSIRVEARRERDVAILSVQDTGIGIEAKDLGRVFQRFHRGESARKHSHGSGLGLSIVKRIVESHGGRIWVDSAPKRGTVFRLTLPLAN